MAFQAAMDLTRRMRPRHIEQDLSDMLVLVPDLVDDLLSAVDQPLKVLKCPVSGKGKAGSKLFSLLTAFARFHRLRL
eukprot:619450-Hanusia_phi.AAC.1